MCPGTDDTAARFEGRRDYALLEGEGAAAGIRRVADGRAADALDLLRAAEGESLAEGVHEARKSLKKLRSVLRLVRPRIGDGIYRLENGRFGDAGRVLSDLRDADAIGEAVDALRERFAGELDPRAIDPLAQALGEDRRRSRPAAGGPPPEVGRAIAMIEAGRAGIARWPLERNGFGLVRPGLHRAYARGRKRMTAVTRRPGDDEAVHEWRKRVKDLWYMAALLERSFPALVGATADQAHELSSLLGDHHDLSVLGERVRDDPGLLGAAMPAPTLLDLIERRQTELLEEALPLGRRLYAEKPKRFTARLEAYWRA